MIGDNLRYIRTMLGLTQRDLEERSGIKEAAISRYEKNKSEPSINNIRRLCKALGCTPNALIDL